MERVVTILKKLNHHQHWLYIVCIPETDAERTTLHFMIIADDSGDITHALPTDFLALFQYGVAF